MMTDPNRSADGADEQKPQFDRVRLLDIVLMTAVGILAFLVYRHTLCSGVYPGISAIASANVFGVLPFHSVNNPLWLLSFRCLSHLPFSDAPHALNTINAVFAALAVVSVYLVVRRLAFLIIRPAPSWRMVPMDAVTEAEDMADAYFLHLTPDLEKENTELLAASLGGLTAAITLMFSAPFWRAATSLHPYPFDLLLALIAIDQIVRYAYSAHLGNGVLAVFLFGALTLEWPVFLLLAPIVAATVIFYAARREQLTESVLFLMLISGLSGIVAAIASAALSSMSDTPFSATGLAKDLYDIVTIYFRTLSEAIHRQRGLTLLALAFLNMVLCVKACSVLNSLTDLATRWKWRALSLLFSVYTTINLLNLPTSIWALTRDLAILPIIPALATAIATGFLFVFWFLTAHTNGFGAEGDYAANEKEIGCLTLGYTLCGVILIAVLRSPVSNHADADGRHANFADQCAYEVMALSADAKCLVTDGLLDLNLRVARKTSRSPLTILSINQVRTAPAVAPPGAKPGVQPTEPLDAKDFLIGWMRANPTAHAQLSFFCPVAFLQQAGIPTPPSGLCYTGHPSITSLEALRGVFEKNRACWLRLQPHLKNDPDLYPILYQQQIALRRFASRVANDMGVYLQQAGLPTEADQAFARALQFDAENLTAMLNQYGLRVCHTEIGPTASIASQTFKRAESQHFFDTFDAECSRGGLLFAQDANAVLPALLADTPIGQETPPILLNLAARWFCRGRTAPSALTPSVQSLAMQQGGRTSTLTLAVKARTSGRSAHSESLLRRVVAEKPENLEAWALLAELALSKNAIGEVERKILPAMLAAKGSDKSPLPSLVEGALHLHAQPPRVPKACACFRHALDVSPGLEAAADQLLQASLRSGDPHLIETDAQAVLASMPSNVLAHALMGSMKLRQRRFTDAEHHLQASMAETPTAGASNDLAELYRLQGRLADAEQFARKAIRLDPCLHQAWDTLGCIMAEMGRLSDADTAFQCETKLHPESANGFLALADVWLKQGRQKEALRLTQFIEKRFASLSPEIRNALTRIRAKLL